jgi:hypothetical protein
MLMSAMAPVDDQLETESHPLRQQMIRKISAEMVALVSGADKDSTTKCRQFRVQLNRSQQAATTWLDTDRQKAKERIEREISQVTSATGKIVDKLFAGDGRQLFRGVGTKVSGHRSKISEDRTLMIAAMKDKATGVAIITPNMELQFQICLPVAETEATSWFLADTQQVTNQVERENLGITSNEQTLGKTELSMRLMEFEAW